MKSLQYRIQLRRRPQSVYLVVAVLLITLLALVTAPLSRAPRASAAGELRVHYRAADTMSTTGQPKPYLTIYNTGSVSVPLSDLKARYYYSKEGTASESFFCDYTPRGCGNVTGTFAVGYLEVGFTSGAGSLAGGQNTGELQIRFAKSDWSSYTQTGDYSFDAARTSPAEHTRVTLYQAGTLVWGTPPGGTPPTSTAIQSTATRTFTAIQSTATRTSTTGSSTATRTSTRLPTATRTNTSGPVVTATRTSTRLPTATRTNTSGPVVTATRTPTQSAPPPTTVPGGGDDWLHVVGNTIVDSAGKPVWLTGLNWFGYNASERVFHGLWSANLDALVKSTAEHGFNLIRVPISTQLILEWKAGVHKPINVNTYANPELLGMNGLQVFDQFLAVSKKYGVKVMLDVHSAEADNSGHVYPVWWENTAEMNITPELFYQAWEWITARYKNDDTLIAMDIKNEPHGARNEALYAKWDGSTDINNWKHACETAGRRILAINPNVLILCEGNQIYPMEGQTWDSPATKSDGRTSNYYNTWWGGNLRGVRDFPVNLGSNQDQLVYSPHDYGPSVHLQPWFEGAFTKESLTNDVWRPNWYFIHEDDIAPLLMGEWGGHMDGGKNQAWMTMLRDFMIEHKIHHTFWCLNPNSGDTGGLIGNDWATWDVAKYGLVKPSLWQTSGGKFVGLDHAVPLGGAGTSYGVSLSAYYAGGGTPPWGS